MSPVAYRRVASCGHPRPCGCKLVSCCEECGFEDCVASEWGGGGLYGFRERNEAIRQMVRNGVGKAKVAECLGLSERTVYRVLAG